MVLRRWLSVVVAAFLCAALVPPTATAAAEPVVTVNPEASAFYTYDPTPDSIGLRFPTVSVYGSIDHCPSGFRNHYELSMTQDGKPIQRVFSGALSEGELDMCPDATGPVNFGAAFGGDQLLLRPGKAMVTITISDLEFVPLAVATGTVTIPPLPKDGTVKILPLSTPAKTATAPGTSTRTKRVTVAAVIRNCKPGVTYTLAAGAPPYNFTRTADGSVDHPVTCPPSGHKVVALTFYGDTFTARKAPFIFLLTGPNGLNWDTRNVIIPRRR